MRLPRRRLRASFSRSLTGGSCIVGAPFCTEWTGVPQKGSKATVRVHSPCAAGPCFGHVAPTPVCHRSQETEKEIPARHSMCERCACLDMIALSVCTSPHVASVGTWAEVRHYVRDDLRKFPELRAKAAVSNSFSSDCLKHRSICECESHY